MERKGRSIADKIMAAETKVNNTLAYPEILAKVAVFGYSELVMQEGRVLVEEVKILNQHQDLKYGEQKAATQRVRELWGEAKRKYADLISFCRLAMRNDTLAIRALNLDGQRKESLTGWLKEANSFYGNLIESAEFQGKLARFNITEEIISEHREALEELNAAVTQQDKEMGDAQESTKLRDIKLDEMEEWIHDFTVVARIALADEQQWLEKLGIFEES